MNEEARKKFEALLADAAKQYNIAHEKFTKKQVMEALKQALLCGEFIRYVNVDNDAQQVVYIPFAREAELQNRIYELEKRLRNTSCCEVCGNYVPGHATGGMDICTCK
jgi:Trk K+ transport system NAD-binding subunit